MAVRCTDNDDPNKLVLLFASDKQVSSPYLKSQAFKIRFIFGPDRGGTKFSWASLFAASGDALVIDEVLYSIDKFLHNLIDASEDDPSRVLRQYRTDIGDIAFNVFSKYAERCEIHPDIFYEYPRFEFILGACSDVATILYVTYEGKTQVLENFKLIGTGQFTGGELLIKEFHRNNLTLKEAAVLSSLIINKVGNVDISVGGGPDFRICKDKRCFSITHRYLDNLVQISEERWDIIKKIWWKMEEEQFMNHIKGVINE